MNLLKTRTKIPYALAWAITASLIAAAAACGKKQTQKESPAMTVYSAHGVIVEIHPQNDEIVINAEAIPGLMDAMTMPYSVKDPSLLQGLKAGESISFDFTNSSDGDSIQKITPLEKKSPARAQPKVGAANPRPDNAAWIHIPKIGEGVPNLSLVDQNGHSWQPRDERGKVAVINFIYTSCPLKNFCPRSMTQLAAIKRDLGPLIGTRVDLLSVTFDPRRDTPAILKRYGGMFGAGDQGWRLLGGRPEIVEKFVSFFDVNYWSGQNGDITNHSLSTAILGPDGRIALFETGDRLSAQELTQAVKKILRSSGGRA